MSTQESADKTPASVCSRPGWVTQGLVPPEDKTPGLWGVNLLGVTKQNQGQARAPKKQEALLLRAYSLIYIWGQGRTVGLGSDFGFTETVLMG